MALCKHDALPNTQALVISLVKDSAFCWPSAAAATAAAAVVVDDDDSAGAAITSQPILFSLVYPFDYPLLLDDANFNRD